MKKSILIKIFVVLISLLVCSLILINNNSNAKSLLGNINDKMDQFKEHGEDGAKINTDNVTKPMVALGQVLTYVGTAVMVAIVTYMGIKYVTSGPEAQAKLKGELVGVIVSGCVIFGSYWIFVMVYNMVKGF